MIQWCVILAGSSHSCQPNPLLYHLYRAADTHEGCRFIPAESIYPFAVRFFAEAAVATVAWCRLLRRGWVPSLILLARD